MLALRDVEVTIEGRAFKLKALLDSGSSFTIMGYGRLKEVLGELKLSPWSGPGRLPF
jgi:hypothetical protein